MVQHLCFCGYETRFKANLRRHQNSSRCHRLAAKPLEVMQAQLDDQEKRIRELQELLTKRSHDEKAEQIERLCRQNEQLIKALEDSGRSEQTVNITNNVVVNVLGKESLSHIDGMLRLDTALNPFQGMEEYRGGQNVQK